MHYLLQKIEQLKAKKLFRWRLATEIEKRPYLCLEGQLLIDFSSNDYLGLRFDEELVKAFCVGVRAKGLGSGGSPLVGGYDMATAEVERQFATWVGAEQALFFSSGYVANLSVFSALFTENTQIFIDKACHASIYDGLTLGGVLAACKRYSHQNFTQLSALLSNSSAHQKVIVAEGIFSMTGTQVDLRALVELKRKHRALLIVDDAHAIGVVGKDGRGSSTLVEPGDIDLVICPLGKAFAMQGAMVAGRHELIEALIQLARPYIYSTAPIPALTTLLKTVMSKIERAHAQRAQLEENVKYFKSCCQRLQLPLRPSDSAIQFLVVGDCTKALSLSETLQHQGIYCRAIRTPTVPPAQAGLRIVLSAAHGRAHIDQLVNALGEALEACH